MKKKWSLKRKILTIVLVLILILVAFWFWPADPIANPEYGATFSAKYARELGLDPGTVYKSLIDEMNIKKMRLVAYWDDIEKKPGEYDFGDLDWQMGLSKEHDVEVILSVGRRVPRWPECHVPDWAYELDQESKEQKLKDFVAETINRYKDHSSITHWQIENEAFFTLFATEICGSEANEKLIDEEIALVKNIDPTRPIVMTDSGNVGNWSKAFEKSDVFGSTFYVYLMFDGQLRSPLTHNVYKFKKAFNTLLHGSREVMLIEVSVEPWVHQAMATVPVEELVDRLSMHRVKNIIRLGKNTGFEKQYLWGVEWLYYMRKNGHPEYWDYISELFKDYWSVK